MDLKVSVQMSFPLGMGTWFVQVYCVIRLILVMSHPLGSAKLAGYSFISKIRWSRAC